HSPISKLFPVSKSSTHQIKTIALMMFALAVMVAAVMLLVAPNAHPRSVLMWRTHVTNPLCPAQNRTWKL
ncbi:hypothetical protein BgiMline_026947, partial [Biomphalaria glabrata]